MVLSCCMAGHDLTVDGAYVYASNGARSCRLCQQPKKKGTAKGEGLTGSWFNQYSESPRGGER